MVRLLSGGGRRSDESNLYGCRVDEQPVLSWIRWMRAIDNRLSSDGGTHLQTDGDRRDVDGERSGR